MLNYIKNNMKLNILYSPELEVERIINTLKRVGWYKENGYTVQLPESLDISDVTSITPESVKIAVSEDYNEQNYLGSKKYIEEHWNSVGEELTKNIKNTSLVLQNSYDIQLTRYGVGGSYHMPNKIIINIQRMFEFGLLKTIAHEGVHLSIQSMVEKYNVKHWHKERVVDLLLQEFAPKVSSFQKMSINTTKIDEIFRKEYPDVDKVLSSLILLE